MFDTVFQRYEFFKTRNRYYLISRSLNLCFRQILKILKNFDFCHLKHPALDVGQEWGAKHSTLLILLRDYENLPCDLSRFSDFLQISIFVRSNLSRPEKDIIQQ